MSSIVIDETISIKLFKYIENSMSSTNKLLIRLQDANSNFTFISSNSYNLKFYKKIPFTVITNI